MAAFCIDPFLGLEEKKQPLIMCIQVLKIVIIMEPRYMI